MCVVVGVHHFDSTVQVQAEFEAYENIEYFKTDLVASKGIMYVKYKTASTALKALEDMQRNNFIVRLELPLLAWFQPSTDTITKFLLTRIRMPLHANIREEYHA